MNVRKSNAILAAIIGGFLVFLFPNELRAQNPPPPAPVAPARQAELPSLLSGGNFISLEGRFSISLPPDHNGFSGLNVPTPVGIARGEIYSWRLKEAVFVVGHADAPADLNTPETTQKLFASTHDALKKFADANNGTVRPDKAIQVGKYAGVEQRIDLFSGIIIQRTYIVSKRLYQTSIVMKTMQAEFEQEAIKALDTFKLLDESEVAAKEAEAIRNAEPVKLPQGPVVHRVGTDATDDNLRGPVKTLLQENQDLSGTWAVQARKRDQFEEYNKRGDLVRQEFYDYKGNLHEIIVYGYIDGKRVSNSGYISHEYNPPPISVVVGPAPDAKKSDPRYMTAYDFRYDEQRRLIEQMWFQNTGELRTRDVYKYGDQQVETFSYAGNDPLNQRSLSKILTKTDASGNEIERTSFDQDDKPRRTSFYTYEFDSHGNWIKRTTSQPNKEGKLEPQYVDFRTITYW